MLNKADEFWMWFESNQYPYLFINEMIDEQEKERILDEFLGRLHLYNPELFFEIGAMKNADKMDLIITAQGIKTEFASVEELVQKAPIMKNWNIIAFKPPMDNHFTTTIGNKLFDPNKIIFIPLISEDDPDWLGIEVCYPDYTEDEKNEFVLGTYLMLDLLLGEKSTATDIDYLEVVETPHDLVEYPFMHLSSLKEYIEETKLNKK